VPGQPEDIELYFVDGAAFETKGENPAKEIVPYHVDPPFVQDDISHPQSSKQGAEMHTQLGSIAPLRQKHRQLCLDRVSHRPAAPIDAEQKDDKDSPDRRRGNKEGMRKVRLRKKIPEEMPDHLKRAHHDLEPYRRNLSA
jgi:hypothetical protein